MKARVRLLLFGASAALFLVVGMTGFALLTWDDRPTFRLPDRSIVRVETVRYGTGGDFRFGPSWRRRLAPLAPHLPPPLADSLQAGSMGLGLVTPKGALAVSLSHEGSPDAEMPFCDLRDSHGCRYWPVNNFPYNENGENANVSFFPFFPRREPAFRLEAIVSKPAEPDLVRSVTLPSPTPTRHPTWTADPLPATQSSGPLAVTLTDVSTGWGRTHLHRPAFRDEVQATRLAYHLDPASREWRPVGVSLADAMGDSYRFETEMSQEPGALYVSGDNLCRQEPAYRFSIEFTRGLTPAAKPERVYRFPKTRVPDAEPGAPFTYLTLPDGRQLTLVAFETDRDQQLQGNWQPHAGEIGRIWAYDRRGRLLGAGTSSLPGGEPRSQMLRLRIPRGIRQIELRLGTHTSRTVTFTVKPRWITR